MPHEKRIKAVATVFACNDLRGAQAFCQEKYMVEWISDHMGELLDAIETGNTYVETTNDH